MRRVSTPPPASAPLEGGSSIASQRATRLAKVDAFRARGVNPYPERFERSHTAEGARAVHDDTIPVALAGRLMQWRDMGKLTFARLQDFSGVIQLALRQETLGVEDYKFFQKHLDLGDLVGVRGTLFTTKTGERTLAVQEVTLLGKALRPLPEKWHGLADQESRYRQRYLDLLVNPTTQRVFRVRTRLLRALRSALDANGFEEVETPILQNTASGAMAKPFVTHHHALDLELSLRIAPETYLKRLVVGGYERVYEVAKCFRNEGIDPSHLQEFTQIEFYAAYWNFEDNMRFTEQLLTTVFQEILGTLQLDVHGQHLDFSGPWPRRRFLDLFQEEAGIDPTTLTSVEAIRAVARARDVELELEPGAGRATALDSLYKKLIRPKLIQPQFILAHPADLMPLARRNDADPSLVDSFQLLVNGWEVVKAYSELVDPVMQRAAFETQAEARAAGDEEAMAAEEDYLEAMEHGMPPISGWGMGIDRIVALIQDQPNLRDTVFFPTMRPASEASSADATPDA